MARAKAEAEVSFYTKYGMHLFERLRKKREGSAEKKAFVRACPSNMCRGFLSSQWKCGICNVWVCPDCHEIKGDSKDSHHECNPDNVASAKQLAKDTKPCPKCASSIFKISGCDQMYCTQCHTAFSWKTGNIVKGVIHNPHYYEYMRNQGYLPRNPGDNPCGDANIPQLYTISRFLSTAKLGKSFTDEVYKMHNMVMHIVNVTLQAPQREDNADLRIRYLLQDISEQELKLKVQKREKAANKKRIMHDILRMYTTVISDMFRQMLTLNTNTEIQTLFSHMKQVQAYTEDQLNATAAQYGCVAPSVVRF
jgi:ribosomal protein S27AE